MDLGVLEGQTKGGYFSDSIFDPSVNQCNANLEINSTRQTPTFVLAPLPFPTDLLDKVRVQLNQSKVDAACELVLLGVARASSRLPGVLPRGPPPAPAPAPALQPRLGTLTISSQPKGDARHRLIVLRVCIHTSQVSLVQAWF